MTVGRLRHTLQRYFGLQLPDPSTQVHSAHTDPAATQLHRGDAFEQLLQCVYGASLLVPAAAAVGYAPHGVAAAASSLAHFDAQEAAASAALTRALGYARVVDYRALIAFVLQHSPALAPSAAAGGAGAAAASAAAATPQRRLQLRPELVVLRGKVCRALNAAAEASARSTSAASSSFAASLSAGAVGITARTAGGQEGDLRALFRQADYSLREALPWAEFARVLREGLGLQVPASAATDAPLTAHAAELGFVTRGGSAGAAEGGGLLAYSRDHSQEVAERQLARAAEIAATGVLRPHYYAGSAGSSDSSKAGGPAALRQQGLQQREWQAVEAEREAELALAELVREGRKRDLLRGLLRDTVTTTYRLYPSFGRAVFWEHTLLHPDTAADSAELWAADDDDDDDAGAAGAESFTVSVADPAGQLRLVQGEEEWTALLGTAGGSSTAGSTGAGVACPDAGREAAPWLPEAAIQAGRRRFLRALARAAGAAAAANSSTAAGAGASHGIDGVSSVSPTRLSFTVRRGQVVVLPFVLLSYEGGDPAPEPAEHDLAAAAAVALRLDSLDDGGVLGPGAVSASVFARAAALTLPPHRLFDSSSSASQPGPITASSGGGIGAPGTHNPCLYPLRLSPELLPYATPRRAEITVSARHSAATVALLSVLVAPRPMPPVTRTLLYCAGEGEMLRGAVPLPPVPFFTHLLQQQAGPSAAYSILGPGASESYAAASGPYAAAALPPLFVRVPEAHVAASIADTEPPAAASVLQHTFAPRPHHQQRQQALQHRELRFRLQAGGFGCLSAFHLCLYTDPHAAGLQEVWRVVVLPLRKVALHTLVGQTSAAELTVRGPLSMPPTAAAGRYATLGDVIGSGAAASALPLHLRTAELACSHPSEVAFPPPHDRPFLLPPGLLPHPAATGAAAGASATPVGPSRLRLSVTPHLPGQRRHAVLLLDSASRGILDGWYIHSAAALPAVTRSYAVSVPVGVRVDKRIPYANEWQSPRTFTVRSSHPHLVTLRGQEGDGDGGGAGTGAAGSRLALSSGGSAAASGAVARLRIPALSRGMIRLRIGPLMGVGCAEVLLFVSNESGQAEEALLLQITVG
jgi:hypothetical protein